MMENSQSGSIYKHDSSNQADPQPVSQSSASNNNANNDLIENRYRLLQQIDRTKAKEIEEQTGVIFKFPADVETIDAVLGRGQFGELRIGFDEQKYKYVGVKVIRGRSGVAESQQEATLQNALKGKPNIMQLYHFVQVSNELLYQIMPLAGLGSVDKLKIELAKLNDAKLKELILLHIAQGLLIGLWAMHKEHIYHLDKKPGNLLINVQGEVYVGDFGCSVKSENGKICAPNTKGDHHYLSPERWVAEQENETSENAYCDGAKVDLWAAGITLLELLTNQNLFSMWRIQDVLSGGKTALEHYVKVTLANIPELQNPDEQSLWGLVKHLLELDPEKRFTALQALNSPLFTDNPDIHNPQIMQTAISYLKTFVKNTRFEVKYIEKRQEVETTTVVSSTRYKRVVTDVPPAIPVVANYKVQAQASEQTEVDEDESAARYIRPNFDHKAEETRLPIPASGIHNLSKSIPLTKKTLQSSTILSEVELNNTDKTKLNEIILQQICQPFNKRPDIFEQLKLYIPLEGSLSKTGADPFELEPKIKSSLENQNKVLLLFADGGSGKSLQAQKLTLELAEKYQQDESANENQSNNSNKSWLPIYISLATIQNPKHLLPEIQKQYGLTEQQLQYLLQNYRILLIGDGYDEQKDWVNLYLENKLYQYENLKLLITCRPSALPASYSTYFAPYEPGKPTGFYDEIYLQPFTSEKIDNYIKQYFQLNEKRLRTEVTENFLSEEWGQLETYQKAIEDIAGLKELIKTPLMCRLTLEALPELSKQLQHTKQTQKIERVQVYEAFMQRWIKQQIALRQLKMSPEKALEFGQQLALEMFKDKVASVELGKFHFKFNETQEKFIQVFHRWQTLFNENTLAERSSLPIQEMGENKYKFLHFSIQEFLLARHLYQQLIQAKSLKDLDWNKIILTVDVKDRPVLYFLGDLVNVNPQFEQALFDLVNQTKTDKSQSRAGANAITVLNASEALLCSRDFAGVSIPEADLSGGILGSSTFAGADLSKVNLQGSRLIKANLKQSILNEVRLGESPAIELKNVVRCCAFSPDGKKMAVGNESIIELYEIESRKLIRRFEGHTYTVWSVSFNQTGDQLASGGDDTRIRLWDVATGQEIKCFKGHTERVCSLSFNRVGMLASGSRDQTVRLWNVESGEEFKRFKGHTSAVNSVSFNQAGDQLASGGDDTRIRLWDVATGQEIKILEGHTDAVFSVIFNGAGNLLASGSADKTVKLWDLTSSNVTKVLTGHTDFVTSLSFNGAGDKLASGSHDKMVRVWDVASGKEVKNFTGHTEYVMNVCFNSAGDQLASGSFDMTVRLWDIVSSKELKLLRGHIRQVTNITFNRSGDKLASGSHDKTVRVWDFASGKEVKALIGHTDRVTSVSFNEAGDKLASGSWDQTARLWDVASGKELKALTGHENNVKSVSLNGTGDKLATASDNTVLLWDLMSSSVTQVLMLTEFTNFVNSVSFNGTGDMLASGSDDKTVRLWDVESGKELKALTGHTDFVTSLSFNGAGDKLASGSWDHTVRLWDVTSGKELKALTGHASCVNSVSFNGAGDKLASGSNDKTVRLWDVESGQCLCVEQFNEDVYSVAWQSIQQQDYLAVGYGLDVACFKVNIVNKQIQLTLHWLATNAATLICIDADIDGVQGLSEHDLALMQQRGAKGTPQLVTPEKSESTVEKLSTETALKTEISAALKTEEKQTEKALSVTEKNMTVIMPNNSMTLPEKQPIIEAKLKTEGTDSVVANTLSVQEKQEAKIPEPEKPKSTENVSLISPMGFVANIGVNTQSLLIENSSNKKPNENQVKNEQQTITNDVSKKGCTCTMV